MNKKIIALSFLLLTTFGCDKLKTKDENISLMEFDNFKNIVVDKVIQIDYSRLTEGGRSDLKITNQDEIKKIYNDLRKLTVGKETTMACDDNTKLYTFYMNDGNTINIELECDWVVLGNKRYEIK